MPSSTVNLEKCRIPLEEIIRATKNFSSETQIGDGGFGMVYRGQLSEHWENRLVAIKRRHPSNGYQGNTEFNNELQMFSNFNHPYNERGRLSKESDIYSFGVVMFEMSSGMMAYAPRRFSNTAEQFLIDIVRRYYDEHQFVDGLDKLIDTTIKGQIEMSSFHLFNEIAHECINFDKMKRPTMERIIEGLRKALDVQETSRINTSILVENDLSIEAQVEKMQESTSGEKLDMLGENDLSIEGQVEIMQETSGENTHMLGPKDLIIAWQDDSRFWKWERTWGSRFRKVWILREVCWIKINGNIAAATLSQEGTYGCYLIFRTTEDCSGLDVPATSEIVSFGGKQVVTENVYLQRPRHMQENYVVPQRRKDGWMETKLGEFVYKDGDDGHVQMVFKEVKVLNWKRGLIVEGIEIRPK